jgi:hypothetical protein
VAGLAAVVAIGAVHLAPGRADDLPIAVLASSTLGPAFSQIDAAPEYSFADSDLLANSLRLGARADVFAAAGADQPQALARQGRIGRPVAFATTRLVLILPRANRRRVGSVYDLGRRGVRTLLGDASLSFGRQSRAVLSRLRVRTASTRTARDPAGWPRRSPRGRRTLGSSTPPIWPGSSAACAWSRFRRAVAPR